MIGGLKNGVLYVSTGFALLTC